VIIYLTVTYDSVNISLKSGHQREEQTMIQITGKKQFTKAAERARRERMLVQPAGFRRYYVTNKSNSHRYEVFFSIMNGKKFGACNCEAGYPMNSRHVPMVCKHLFSALLVHTSLVKAQTSH
jgi:hypothetical protein